MSDSLQPHGLQHARLPYCSLSPGACSDSTESVMLSNHLILCCPLLLLPSVFSSIRVFSNESTLRIRWPKYWSFNFSIYPFQWILRTDFLYGWLVWPPCSPRDSQESSPAPRFKSINSSVLAFFMVQLSQLHVTTGKTIAIQTFVGKVISLLFKHTI